MSAYRSDDAGLAARLADLRAAWQVERPPVRDAIDAFVARGTRVGGGLVAVAVQALLLGSIVVTTLLPGLPRWRLPLLPAGPALFAGYLVAKLVGRRLGARAAREHAARLVSGEAAPADPVRAVAWFAEQRRADVLARDARRLEPASVALHMLSGHLFAFQLSVCSVLALGEPESRRGDLLLGLLALLLLHLVAMVAALAGLARRTSPPILTIVLPVGVAAAAYALGYPPVLGIALLFQAALLVIRGLLVHSDVTSERLWLC